MIQTTNRTTSTVQTTSQTTATSTSQTTATSTSTRETFVPVWRRRQIEELAANGGRIVARSVTAGGRDVAL